MSAAQVAIGVGDLGLAYQAFRIAISVEASHAESYNNLGVLRASQKLFLDKLSLVVKALEWIFSYRLLVVFHGATSSAARK